MVVYLNERKITFIIVFDFSLVAFFKNDNLKPVVLKTI